jgi:hypothetical protein
MLELKDNIIGWLQENNIHNIRDVHIHYDEIHLEYFGDELLDKKILDFERKFNVKNTCKNILLLGYKNYNPKIQEYVDINHCKYVFS